MADATTINARPRRRDRCPQAPSPLSRPFTNNLTVAYRWGIIRPPGALKAISEAFDAAWAEIADKFGKDPTEIELARHRLANAVLAVASEDSRDLEALKKAALQRMALDYRKL